MDPQKPNPSRFLLVVILRVSLGKAWNFYAHSRQSKWITPSVCATVITLLVHATPFLASIPDCGLGRVLDVSTGPDRQFDSDLHCTASHRSNPSQSVAAGLRSSLFLRTSTHSGCSIRPNRLLDSARRTRIYLRVPHRDYGSGTHNSAMPLSDTAIRFAKPRYEAFKMADGGE
jgi:hypothetical protein